MKTPDRDQASTGVVGEQLALIDPPPFSPQYPPQSSLASVALKTLLGGKAITHPEFEDETRSWRLGAYVFTLRELGWPVVTQEIHSPTPDAQDRVIARYSMPHWVIDAVEVNHGE